MANSAGIALGEGFHGQITRPGLALYGGVPCSILTAEIRQVALPEAQLIQRRKLQAGETIGYNATFTAAGSLEVGVVSLGYADGYLRCWSGGKGAMQHGGRHLPVLGRVSMDMLAVDLTTVPAAGLGSEVTLWGRGPGDTLLAIDDVARASGTIGYELMCAVAPRVLMHVGA